MIRFLDANVFIYAYYKPKRKLNEKEKKMKDKAKEIINRIMSGEKIITSVVHLSEVANILKHALSLADLNNIIFTLLSMQNIEVIDVTKDDYLRAVSIGQEFMLDPNDALAVTIMDSREINEIYSFDKNFDKIKWIKRVPHI
ncbi:MAG: type II toxin-antitoxin system VapC family toxin [Candidatus Njordarchaeia archaeon]|nr:type II toxin-antitoxin system VapC family toxin [Candidatus Korarchaeota archaeon]